MTTSHASKTSTPSAARPSTTAALPSLTAAGDHHLLWRGGGDEAVTLSRLIYGLWRLADDPDGCSPQQVARKIELCLELGITTFDHADLYGDYRCEELFGAGLRLLAPHRRGAMQLVSKCGIKLLSKAHPEHLVKHYDTSGEHLVASVDTSLRRLAVSYLDVLLLHRPDPLLAADEVAAAFVELRAAGKVRQFGVSNFTPAQVELLASRLPFALLTNQIEFSPLQAAALTDGCLDQCQRLNIVPMAWSPLAGGRLLKDASGRAGAVRQALAAVAEELSTPHLEQVALAWIWRHPAQVCAIIGTNQAERIRIAAAGQHLRLNRQQWHRIWSASLGGEVP